MLQSQSRSIIASAQGSQKRAAMRKPGNRAWYAIQHGVFAGVLMIAGTTGAVNGQELTANATAAGSSQLGQAGSQTTQPVPIKITADLALNNQILEEAGEEQNITYMESHVAFKYRYDALDGGMVDGNEIRLRWQQAIGKSKRMAASIELPFAHISEPENQSAGGLGDIKLEFRGMLSKGEKFEQAAGVELTLPSASSDALGEGQTVLRLVWGCSGQLTPHTVLTGEFAYNKAVANSHAGPGVNSIEPELILSQIFAKRVGGYLNWDNYYEFNVDKYINTMKVALEIALDKKDRWGFAPYAVFPLSHASSLLETKLGVGFDLTYAF